MKRITSLVASTAFLLAGLAAQAQDAPPAAAPAPAAAKEADEEIIVTGSRIKRQDVIANSPVSIIGTEELDLNATVNVEEIIREMPQAVAGATSGTNNGNPGAATVNLRGLDDERTLVLIDGKRFVGYDSEGIVDLNNIPTPLVERIDVVTGGASAVYGSDAIAGVVNFILKDDFEGVQVDYDYGMATRDGEDTHNIGITMGGNFDDERGNAAIYVGWTSRDAIVAGNHDYFETARATATGRPSGSSTDTNGNVFTYHAGAYGFTPAGELIPRGDRRFNFNPYNLLQVPEERYQATGVIHYDLTEWATVYGRATFAQTQIDSIIAPSGTFLSEFNIPYDSVFMTDTAREFMYNVNPAPGDPAGAGITQTDIFGDPTCKSDPSIPAPPLGFDLLDTNCDGTLGLGDSAPFVLGRRFTESGPRTTRNRTQAYQVVGGLRGDIPWVEGWEYDFSIQHARTEMSRVFENDAVRSRIQDVLDGSSASANPGAFDGGPCLSSAPSTCVLGNMFGDGNLSAETAAYMSLQINEEIYTTQDVILLSASGDLGETLHIPGADPIGLAFGFEWRRTKSESFPDDCYSTPDCSIGFGSTTAVRADQYVKEIFGEVLVPILADLPFAHSLSFEAGYRWADYDTVGGVSAYKVGGEWAPIEDLRFRVLYQNAVRAPNIFENYQPTTPGLDNSVGDPCAGFAEANEGALPLDTYTVDLCIDTGAPAGLFRETAPGSGVWTTLLADVVAGQINAIGSGNSELKEETSKTLTLGGVYQPSWLEGMTIQIDWYRIEIEDAISNFDPDVILGNCYNQAANPGGDPNSEFCSYVLRNPTTGALIGNPLYGVLEPELNISTLKTAGLDLSVDYDLDLGWGRLDMFLLGTKLFQRDDKPSDITPTNVCKGLYGTICNQPNASVTLQQRSTLYVGDFFAGYRWRYIEGTEFEDPGGAFFNSDNCLNRSDCPETGTIDSMHYFDVVFGWEPSDMAYLNGFRFQIAVDNLFDQDAPIVGQEAGPTDTNSVNTFPGVYDVVGRAVTFSISKKF